MDKVQRYALGRMDDGSLTLIADEYGLCVTYRDYAALQARIAELEARIAASDRLRNVIANSPEVDFWHGYDEYGVTFDGDGEGLAAASDFARLMIGTGWRVRLVPVAAIDAAIDAHAQGQAGEEKDG